MTSFYYYSTLFIILSVLLTVFYKTPSFPLKCIDETCFGDDLCKDFAENKFHLQYNSLSDFISNWISVKNVYFARYLNRPVVIKKYSPTNRKFTIHNNSQIQDFIICDEVSLNDFLSQLKDINYSSNRINSILGASAEPLLLDLFKSDSFPLPELIGYCGDVAVMENCGNSLISAEKLSWNQRAFIAIQLITSAVNFTGNHPRFRLYLTDISPDNIVFDAELNIKFVDLENAILTRKSEISTNAHVSDHLDSSDFAYFPADICKAQISDHNIYAICRLLLSTNAPWPMMKGGLLRSPPSPYSELFQQIENCVHNSPMENFNRFQLAESIIHLLKLILTTKQ